MTYARKYGFLFSVSLWQTRMSREEEPVLLYTEFDSTLS
jgi:hypothetical protein